MLHLELTKEEQNTLREAIQDCLSDLPVEIADTDNWTFKNMLRNRREILTKVLALLQKRTQNCEQATPVH